MTRSTKAALIALLIAGSGCYTYHPVRPGDLATGAQVRATVSSVQAAELSAVLNSVSPQVVGSLADQSDGQILVDVPVANTTAGMSTRAMSSRVTIPLSELVSLESRTLSRTRTALAFAIVAAGVGGGWAAVKGGDNVEDKPKTGTDNAIITIFRIPFGIFR